MPNYLKPDQLQSYEEQGLLFIPECFSPNEVAAMQSQLSDIYAEDSPRRVVEKGGERVRSVYGSHATNAVFERLCRDPRVVCGAMDILKSDVYVYQFKINAKAAFDGDVWEWHQDYIFWLKEDGMQQPRVVSVIIFLDEVNEFNGPMYFIPGSHKQLTADVMPNDAVLEQDTIYRTGPTWISNLTAALKYSLDRQTVANMARKYGMVAPKGPAGSVLFFHGNTYHCSPTNMSPFDRNIAIATFNSTENIPTGNGHEHRPDFLCSRDVRPIAPLAR